ncbi:hypothetical protein [Wenzhouxiangella sp. EGI_FJ10409]|uniref:hypothetical protein n=1 Tax=Wenzhouxiangella sp. EGI_FJ10409 TaxID=3243767 RepID=UPI0035DC77C9
MRLTQVVVVLVAALIGLTARPAAFALEVEFVADPEVHRPAAEEYREIWREDGARILEALRDATGVRLREKHIRIIVYEGISRSGRAGRPMYLRASYPASTKRATLVHELAHRYLVRLDSETIYSDIHFPLSLLLFQVWSDLWGEDFARTQASVESSRAQRYTVSRKP